MKYKLSILTALLCVMQSFAQSDCNSATSICDFVYEETDSPAGTGMLPNEMPPASCNIGGETNSAWYIFSPQSDGMFGFILEPSAADDYDWSLFDITDFGCEGISTGLSPEISCNSYGEDFGVPNGPTGISTAEGGIGNVNGPGNLNGPPFNEDVAVTEGRIYALVVMNFSATLNGYALDYTSSGVSIFDNTAPSILDMTTNWCTGEVELVLSEEIDVSTLTAADFILSDPTYSVTGFTTPTENLSSTLQFTIAPTPIAPEVQLQLSTTGGEILADICDNELLQPIDIDLSGNFFFSVQTTEGCNQVGATLDVDAIGNSIFSPLSLSIDNVPQDGTFVANLPGGTYNITVIDNLGCSRDTVVELISVDATVTMPPDETLCSLSETFTAVFTGGLILWDAPPGITIAQPASGTTLISADQPGAYILSATVTDQGCTSTGNFTVTFNNPPASTTTVEDAGCFGSCAGTVTVQNESLASLTISLNGKTAVGQTAVLDSVCAGQYLLEIIFSPTCLITESITINQLPPLTAAFEPASLVLPYANPQVTLTSLSENADSLYWQALGLDSVTFSDTVWELTFPQEPGIYDVQLMAFDTAGCMDMYTASFEVRDDFRFFMPNGFTPNDDGLNDFFAPSFSYEPEFYHLQIFNRYGDVVFDSRDYREVWLGDHRGDGYYVPNGIYNYVLTTRGVERDMKTYKGTVTVMR